MAEQLEAVRLRGVRKVIADRMQASLQSTAQLTYHADADITHLLAERRLWKEKGRLISLEDCLIFALSAVLAELPEFNGTSDTQSIHPSASIDMSLAISSPAGLMTPVLKGVETFDLDTLAETRRDVVGRALKGKLAVSEMKGGSFTLSNLGHTRVRYFTPILNAGQIAILGVGRLETRLALSDQGEVCQQSILPLSLTADHRIVDGEPAGRFLTLLCEQLEDFDDTRPNAKT